MDGFRFLGMSGRQYMWSILVELPEHEAEVSVHGEPECDVTISVNTC